MTNTAQEICVTPATCAVKGSSCMGTWRDTSTVILASSPTRAGHFWTFEKYKQLSSSPPITGGSVERSLHLMAGEWSMSGRRCYNHYHHHNHYTSPLSNNLAHIIYMFYLSSTVKILTNWTATFAGGPSGEVKIVDLLKISLSFKIRRNKIYSYYFLIWCST